MKIINKPMKNNFIITLSLLVAFSVNLSAQDQKAKAILTKLSDQTKTANTISAEFTSTLENKSENIDESRKGKILAKGESYRIYLDDMEILTDGKTVWTIIPDAEEVQINTVPEEGEMADFSNPTKIATMWEKGFKYSYVKEEVIDGTKTHLIHLFPLKPAEKDFHTIKLYVNQASSNLQRIIIKGKTGTDVIYDITSFKLNEAIPESTFLFKNATYSSYDLIDLR
tara:strand:+ start:63 stop:740 length:678 start_codon:yes stop_codon:yes gene_type:complete